MKRWRDKYVAESARAFGLALVIGGLLRDDPPGPRSLLIGLGLVAIVSGWFFSKPKDDDTDEL